MEPKTKKLPIWTYSPMHSFNVEVNNTKIKASMKSQLYQIGVYVSINNDPSLQFSSTPKDMASGERKLKKQAEQGKISDLELSPAIRVTTDEDGFFIQLKDENTSGN